MLMTEYKKLIKSTKPCKDGFKWFLKASKNHKTTNTFFDSLSETEKAPLQPWSCGANNYYENCRPHAYLIYMFRMTLDWEDEDLSDYAFFNISEIYGSYIKEQFGVTTDFDIPIPLICKILKGAFK